MNVIYSCPDCDGDLERDAGGDYYCPGCERTVPYAVLHDGDPDD